MARRLQQLLAHERRARGRRPGRPDLARRRVRRPVRHPEHDQAWRSSALEALGSGYGLRGAGGNGFDRIAYDPATSPVQVTNLGDWTTLPPSFYELSAPFGNAYLDNGNCFGVGPGGFFPGYGGAATTANFQPSGGFVIETSGNGVQGGWGGTIAFAGAAVARWPRRALRALGSTISGHAAAAAWWYWQLGQPDARCRQLGVDDAALRSLSRRATTYCMGKWWSNYDEERVGIQRDPYCPCGHAGGTLPSDLERVGEETLDNGSGWATCAGDMVRGVVAAPQMTSSRSRPQGGRVETQPSL